MRTLMHPKRQRAPAREGFGRIAVIGAGACGLVAAKCLRDESLEPVVFEQASHIGGLWQYSDALGAREGRAYRSLRTNTSKQVMAFSDYPFPPAVPDFPHHTDVLTYLHGYVDHFGLRDHIRLNTIVEAVLPDGRGRWTIRSRSVETTTTEPFDAVVVCSGLYSQPLLPPYPGAAGYQGRVVHSSDYRVPDAFTDQDVVIVGIGSSGADIAVEVSSVARHVLLSVRNPAWLIPHYIGIRPYDHYLTRLSGWLPYRLRIAVFRGLLLHAYKHMGLRHPLKAWQMSLPPFDLWSTRLTASSDLLPRIASGGIAIRPSISELEPQHVVFTDGTRARADAIICCTGYSVSFPFLADTLLDPIDDTLDLYKYVFHPEQPNLAFIGFCIVAGPLLPVAELQARWAARVFTGTSTLPTATHMQEEIRHRHAKRCQLGAHPLRVQLLDYMEDLAAAIGVCPKLWRHLHLVRRLLLGSLVAAQYRMDGPGNWDAAETVVSGNVD
jgi:dimethylaniline monooxygenase (N-oxide forming)